MSFITEPSSLTFGNTPVNLKKINLLLLVKLIKASLPQGSRAPIGYEFEKKTINERILTLTPLKEINKALNPNDTDDEPTMCKNKTKPTLYGKRKLEPVLEMFSVPKEIRAQYKKHKKKCKKVNKFVRNKTLNSLSDPAVLGNRHLKRLTDDRLIRSSDVQENPGPNPGLPDDMRNRDGPSTRSKGSTLVMSYNVRGLTDDSKLRHLINSLYKKAGGKDRDFIACLQETYIEKENRIPYLWRGNYVLTPGTGNGCGCITLLSSHLNVVGSCNVENRAHVIACQKSGEVAVSYIVANIYAPNPNTSPKMDFYERVFDTINEFKERFDCDNILLAGDFNLNMKENEMKNRNFSVQEKRIANFVKDLAKGTGLIDCWESESSFTWRRPNSDTFSTIDRIFFSKNVFKSISCTSNWALGFSDHAAVEAYFDKINLQSSRKSRLVRLDPTLVKDPVASEAITKEFNEMFREALETWDPHMRLEYAKVCIRTVCERVQAERKRKDKSEEESLNEELNSAIEALAEGSHLRDSAGLIDYIEELRTRKSILVERRGKYLAEKLGTKWYNEGEKSTRYFMRLLNRTNPDCFKKIEKDSGETVTDNEGIEREIIDYYSKLYENFDCEIIDQSDDNFFDNIEAIPGADENEICKDITTDDLRKTLHSCKDSSPGPDGIPYSILGLLWPTYGPLLALAWKFSLSTKKLAPSHKVSYLKLIPKAGKNLDKLTNWRPITLSNCDHKLITKTYANRMCEKIAPCLKERQTAYLKGRLINDNLRAMIATIEIANVEDTSGLIVALDAKKAFDSVSHSYLELVLKKFGCTRFIPIFNTLYAELQTDVLINGRIVKGYKIKRGVKQGDALSCILFIMCMEPLLRNIDVVPITSTVMNSDLPKTYAYADDVSGTIKDCSDSLEAFFGEYERLTKMSGLELNADKTEIMRLGKDPIERTYRVSYMGRTHEVKTSPCIKINGISLYRNLNELTRRNVDQVIGKMDAHFRRWSQRSLSTLGKILIAKTFGISQIIYLMQTLCIGEKEIKKINATLYKFIWNRHYLAAKAPERIKREIVNKPIHLGGFGMLDVTELDASLKIKALGRLLASGHPFMTLIRGKLNLTKFFSPRCNVEVESVVTKGLSLLTIDRNKLWEDSRLNSNLGLLSTIAHMDVKDILNKRGINSLVYFVLRRQVSKVGELRPGQLSQLKSYIDKDRLAKVERAIASNLIRRQPVPLGEQIFIKNVSKPLIKCTSKEIRTSRANLDPIKEFKLGVAVDTKEALTLGFRLTKLTSVKHKTNLLRAMHGDIYTKVKLKRFGLIAEDICPRCNEPETLQHKIYECVYCAKIWKEVLIRTGQRATNIPKAIIGIDPNESLATLTIKSEILSRILQLREEQSYLVHPKKFVSLAIEALCKRETKAVIKSELQELRDHPPS